MRKYGVGFLIPLLMVMLAIFAAPSLTVSVSDSGPPIVAVEHTQPATMDAVQSAILVEPANMADNSNLSIMRSVAATSDHRYKPRGERWVIGIDTKRQTHERQSADLRNKHSTFQAPGSFRT